MARSLTPNILIQTGEHLASLPGIGPKMAAKLAVYMATKGRSLSELLQKDLIELRNLNECEICGNLTDKEICQICDSGNRDNTVLMVLETVTDLMHVEESAQYKGRYLVLSGLISPLSGISPADLNIGKLVDFLDNNNVTEVILGLSSTVEGEATSIYLQENVLVGYEELEVTQLARGLPSGVNVEYLDNQTLQGALSGRKSV